MRLGRVAGLQDRDRRLTIGEPIGWRESGRGSVRRHCERRAPRVTFPARRWNSACPGICGAVGPGYSHVMEDTS
jgi:hypothetical protein